MDVVVVGLGAAGSAVLHQLAARGHCVVGLDAEAIPNTVGSSHGHSRVIREAYFEHPAYVPLVQRAAELWRVLERAADETLYVNTGALVLGPPDHEGMVGVMASVTRHKLAHEQLTGDEVRARFPALRPGDGDVGVLEQRAGFLVPERCVAAQVEAAIACGATARAHDRVVAIDRVGGGFMVTTQSDRIAADKVVVCAGPWIGQLVPELAGLSIVRQVQLWLTPSAPAQVGPDALPVFIHFVPEGAFYGLPRYRHPGIKICQHHGGQVVDPGPDGLDRQLRPGDVDGVRVYVKRHLPVADGPVLAARVCMYTNTPDQHFVLGAHPDIPGLLVAGGFSGHGFKFAPVVGEIMGDLVEAGRTSHDVALFDPGRVIRHTRG